MQSQCCRSHSLEVCERCCKMTTFGRNYFGASGRFTCEWRLVAPHVDDRNRTVQTGHVTPSRSVCEEPTRRTPSLSRAPPWRRRTSWAHRPCSLCCRILNKEHGPRNTRYTLDMKPKVTKPRLTLALDLGEGPPVAVGKTM